MIRLRKTILSLILSAVAINGVAEIEIPAAWAGKSVTMLIDGVDDKDIVYFNGEKIGENSGWNKARNYTIPAELVKAGKAIVAIRIIDASGGGGVGFTDYRLRSL